jgi:elongation factor P hydroxylase
VGDAECITRAFNAELGVDHLVRIIGGAPEPLYLPVTQQRCFAEIYFREDYAASALHELAHWCLAGKKRRALEDYGYWYESQRDEFQQQKFEAVETKPQAIEWMLSVAAGISFRISSDNFDIEKLDVEPFRKCVKESVLAMIKTGLPVMVKVLGSCLADKMPNGNANFNQECYYRNLPDK